MRTKIVITTLSLLALAGGTNGLFAEDKAVAAEPTQEQMDKVSRILEDPYKARLMQLKSVRDKHQDEIRALEKQVAARKEEIGKEDPEVGKLAADIEELIAKGEEMQNKLNAKYSGDAELKKLRAKAVEIRTGFTQAQKELNEEAQAAAKAREEAREAEKAAQEAAQEAAEAEPENEETAQKAAQKAAE